MRFLVQLKDRYIQSENLRKIAHNIGWLSFDNILRATVGLFISVWIARYLGPSGLGKLNYAAALVLMLGALSALGLDNIVVRNIARDPSHTDNILGTVFILKLIGGAVSFFLVMTAAYCLQPKDMLGLSLVSIIGAGLVLQAFDAIDFYFQSRVKSKYVVFSRSSAFLVVSLANLFFLFNRAPLVAFACARFAEIALAGLGLVVAYRMKRSSFRDWRFKLEMAKSLLKESWPVVISGIAVMIQAYSDQVLLAKFRGTSELGQYSAALQVVAMLGFIPVVIASSLAPSIARSRKIGRAIYERQLGHAYQLMWLTFIFTAIPVAFFASKIVFFLYGRQYQYAGILLSLMTIRLLFANMGVIRGLFLINENLLMYALIPTLLGAIINVGLNCFLVPWLASVGAIISMIVSFSVTTFLIDLCYAPARANVKLIFSFMVPWRGGEKVA